LFPLISKRRNLPYKMQTHSRQFANGCTKLGFLFENCEAPSAAFTMADGLTQIAHLLNSTLSPDAAAVRAATDLLDRLSTNPHFPFRLLTLSTGINFISLFNYSIRRENNRDGSRFVFREQEKEIKARKLPLLPTSKISLAVMSISRAKSLRT